MTAQEQKQIQEAIRTSPRTIWGYWPFVLPVIVVIIGVAVQIALLSYFKKQASGLEVCVRLGTKIEVLWDSQLVKEATLTVSLSITATFGLLAFLARQAFKQMGLLRTAAKDLGIDGQDGPASGSQPAPLISAIRQKRE
jgi:hypothetical protein